MHNFRLPASVLALVVVTVCAAGCGGSDSSASSGSNSSDARDAAQVKLRSCMRKNGVDIPDSPGQGGGVARQDIDRATLEKAQKACQKYQREAFGDVSADQQQQFRDAFAKFSSCMRQHDVDVPDPGAGGGGPPAGGNRLDQSDPKVKAASKACADKLPRGGPGTGPGPGQQDGQ